MAQYLSLSSSRLIPFNIRWQRASGHGMQTTSYDTPLAVVSGTWSLCYV